MNEKQNYNKLPIIIGIVALVFIAIAIGVGYLFRGGSPDKVFESFFNEISEMLITTVDNSMPDSFDINKNDVSVTGNVAFDTTYDLEELSSLTNYSIGFQLDASAAKQLSKISLSLNEDQTELLLAKIFFQNEKGYFDIPGILPCLLELSDTDMELDSDFNVNTFHFNKEDYKILIERLKTIFIETFDSSQFSKNQNVQEDFNGTTVSNATEYIYFLNEENQRRTWQEMLSKILEDDSLIQAMANLTNLDKDEVRTSIENAENDFEYESDFQMILTTTGAFQDVIAFKVTYGEDVFSVIDYNEQETVIINDQVFEFVKEGENIVLSFDYEGTPCKLTLGQTKESDTKYGIHLVLEISSSGESFKVSFDGVLDYNANISKEEIVNSKKEDEFTEDEKNQIYINFLKKIEGTSLESLFQSFFLNMM